MELSMVSGTVVLMQTFLADRPEEGEGKGWAHVLAGDDDEQPSTATLAPKSELSQTAKPEMAGSERQQKAIAEAVSSAADAVKASTGSKGPAGDNEQERLEGAAALAAEAQPTGTTFATTRVHTKVHLLDMHKCLLPDKIKMTRRRF